MHQTTNQLTRMNAHNVGYCWIIS